MIEDQLTRDQRIRLEALAQANIHVQGRAQETEVVRVAEAFSTFIEFGPETATEPTNGQ